MLIDMDRFKEMNAAWDGGVSHSEKEWSQNYEIACGVEEAIDGRFGFGGGVRPGDTVEISDGFRVYKNALVAGVDRFGVCEVCEQGSAFTAGGGFSVSGGVFHRIHESRFVRDGYGRSTVWTWGCHGSGRGQGIYFPLLVQRWIVPYDKPRKEAVVRFHTGKCDPMRRVVVDPGFLSFGELSFRSVSAFRAWAEYTGLGYEKSGESGGGVITRRADRNLTSRYFIRIEDLPDGAKPLYDLSNGEMVVCYCSNDGETVTIWRPNPNSKSVYRPLAWDDAKRFLGNPVGVRV